MKKEFYIFLFFIQINLFINSSDNNEIPPKQLKEIFHDVLLDQLPNELIDLIIEYYTKKKISFKLYDRILEVPIQYLNLKNIEEIPERISYENLKEILDGIELLKENKPNVLQKIKSSSIFNTKEELNEIFEFIRDFMDTGNNYVHILSSILSNIEKL